MPYVLASSYSSLGTPKRKPLQQLPLVMCPVLSPEHLPLSSAIAAVSSSPLECSAGVRHCPERLQWVPFLPLKCSVEQRPETKAKVTSSVRPRLPNCLLVWLLTRPTLPPVGRHLWVFSMPKLAADKYLVGFKLQRATRLTKLHKRKGALAFHCSEERVMFICCCCCYFF